MNAETTPVDNQELVSREEMNVVEYPIGILADRVPRDPQSGREIKTLRFQAWRKNEKGERIQTSWIVSGTDECGLPRGFDFCVLFLITQIWAESDFKTKRIQVGSIYGMLQRMGMPPSGQNYVRVTDALNRLVGTTYYTKNAVWDPQAKTYLRQYTFSLFSSFRLYDPVPGKSGADALPFGYVMATDEFYELIQHGYFKTIDAARFWRLPSAYTRRLFQFLDKRKIHGGRQKLGIYYLAKKLGTPDETLQGYRPARLRGVLEPHFAALVADGYLAGFRFVKERREHSVEFDYAGWTAQEPDEEQPATDEVTMLVVNQVVELIGEGSRGYAVIAVRELGLGRVNAIVAETRQAKADGRIKRTVAAYFTDRVERARQESR